MPATSADRHASATVNARTRQSSDRSSDTVRCHVLSCRTSSVPPQVARTQPEGRAGRGHDQALGEQQPGEPPSRAAQRQAHAEFVAARQRAREQQAGDVGAGDEQHEPDGHHHREERRLEAAPQRRAAGRRRRQSERLREIARAGGRPRSGWARRDRGADLRLDASKARRLPDRCSVPASAAP